ncbi:putative two-component system sensor protein [Yersinia enterocolitica]|nr:putative two-component system sensor protein [Yersinia enterocolitica]
MTSIVNDMLFLSHAHAGDHAAQLTRVSLREETLKTAEYVEASFAEKQLSLKVEGDVIAHIDRRLFHRSLANLRENSARHSPPESTITPCNQRHITGQSSNSPRRASLMM